jgi:hypothetical protein
MRTVWLAAACGLVVAGCAEQQAQQAHQAMLTAAFQQHREDSAACIAKFSESNKDAVARANCLNAADQKYAPTLPYPDLQYLLIAKRSELAEMQAAGKITHAQSALEFSQLMTQLKTEEQRRLAASGVAQSEINANNSLAAAALLQSMQANRPAPYYIPTR